MITWSEQFYLLKNFNEVLINIILYIIKHSNKFISYTNNDNYRYLKCLTCVVINSWPFNDFFERIDLMISSTRFTDWKDTIQKCI